MSELYLDISADIVAKQDPTSKAEEPLVQKVQVKPGVLKLSTSEHRLGAWKDNTNSAYNLKFPYKMPNGHKIVLDITKILQTTDAHLVPITSIKAMVIFGSSVNVRSSWKLGFFPPIQSCVRCKTVPNDVDIFVLVDNQYKPKQKEVIMDGASSTKRCSGYNEWDEVGIMEDGVDIFAMREADFEVALLKKETVPIAIIKTGVLLVGNFPYKLKNPARIVYDESKRPALTTTSKKFLPDVDRAMPKMKK